MTPDTNDRKDITRTIIGMALVLVGVLLSLFCLWGLDDSVHGFTFRSHDMAKSTEEFVGMICGGGVALTGIGIAMCVRHKRYIKLPALLMAYVLIPSIIYVAVNVLD